MRQIQACKLLQTDTLYLHLQITLGEKSFKAWKRFITEQKKEKFKKQHKDQMWMKVNSILSEYQQKKKK